MLNIPSELWEELRQAFARPVDENDIPDLPEVPDLEELVRQGAVIVFVPVDPEKGSRS